MKEDFKRWYKSYLMEIGRKYEEYCNDEDEFHERDEKHARALNAFSLWYNEFLERGREYLEDFKHLKNFRPELSRDGEVHRRMVELKKKLSIKYQYLQEELQHISKSRRILLRKEKELYENDKKVDKIFAQFIESYTNKFTEITNRKCNELDISEAEHFRVNHGFFLRSIHNFLSGININKGFDDLRAIIEKYIDNDLAFQTILTFKEEFVLRDGKKVSIAQLIDEGSEIGQVPHFPVLQSVESFGDGPIVHSAAVGAASSMYDIRKSPISFEKYVPVEGSQHLRV